MSKYYYGEALNNSKGEYSTLEEAERDAVKHSKSVSPTPVFVWYDNKQTVAIIIDGIAFDRRSKKANLAITDLIIERYPEPVRYGMSTGKIPVGVKITHIPTGICSIVDMHRSQVQNRAEALQILERELYKKGFLSVV